MKKVEKVIEVRKLIGFHWFAANHKAIGDGNGNVEQTQTKVHGNDTVVLEPSKWMPNKRLITIRHSDELYVIVFNQ